MTDSANKQNKTDLGDDIDLWQVPDVKDKEFNEEKTNALGLKNNWRYEPPENTDDPEVEPLTVQQIDEIRQAAYDEGFGEGKEEGFTAGYEESKTKGHEEGIVEGNKTGLEQGLADGAVEIAKLSEQWQGLINDLHAPMAKVDKNVEKQLLELLVMLVEAVTKQEAKTNPDILLAAISEGIKALPVQEPQTQIYLNPLDIKIVEAEFGADYISEKSWRLLPAPHIDIGSCQIENSTSNIDLTIKARLKEVLDSFLQQSLYQP